MERWQDYRWLWIKKLQAESLSHAANRLIRRFGRVAICITANGGRDTCPTDSDPQQRRACVVRALLLIIAMQ